MFGFGDKKRTRSLAIDHLSEATANLSAPFAALYLPAMKANIEDIERRSRSLPTRVASKSIRCRAVMQQVLGENLTAQGDFKGIMAYSLREALWLHEHGAQDILIGYPTVDKPALEEFARTESAHQAITLMVDDTVQLDILRSVVPRSVRVRVCIDIDASLRVSGIHIGVRRSSLRNPQDAADIARSAVTRGCKVAGLMFYEAQVAGLQDNIPGISVMKKMSMLELIARRSAVVNAVQNAVNSKLQFVNAGGTGSLSESASDSSVTEVTAGSGIYAPGLFDHYKNFAPEPALFFAIDAVRRPAAGITTLASGGFIASGPSGDSRLPKIAHPAGAAFLSSEGAGEVQSPITAEMHLGERAWLRHAKAGELCERVQEIVVVDVVEGDPQVVDQWPTYRGEGKCFG